MSFRLTERQIPHVERMMANFDHGYTCVDMSETGTGKTITTAFLAKNFFSYLIFVAPASTLDSAIRKMSIVGVTPDIIFSYEKLRGIDKNMDHPVAEELLLRKDYDYVDESGEGKVYRGTDYIPTQKYLDILEQKPKKDKFNVLLVFDEFQKLRNITDTSIAARALINEINKTGNCRVLLLSATPMDKEEQYPNFFSLIGVNKSDLLYKMTPDGDIFYTDENGNSLGFRQIYDFCLNINSNETKKIAPKINDVKAGQLLVVIKALFHNVFKPRFCSIMNGPVAESKNMYYSMNSVDAAVLNSLIINLQTVFGYDSKINDLNYRPQIKNTAVFAKLNEILENIERCKLGIFCRLVISEYEKNSNTKIAVCLNYKNNISKLSYLLRDYSPLVAHGDINFKQRDLVYNKFQQHDNEYRILICSVKSSGTSIDLHDTSPGGKHQRQVFICPDYSYISAHQLLGRFWREGYTSEPKIYYVFGMNASTAEETNKESRLVNALARKAKVVQDIKNMDYRFDASNIEDYKVELPEEVFEVSYQEMYDLF